MPFTSSPPPFSSTSPHPLIISSRYFFCFVYFFGCSLMSHTRKHNETWHCGDIRTYTSQAFYMMYWLTFSVWLAPKNGKMSSQAKNRLSRQQSRGIVGVLGWTRDDVLVRKPRWGWESNTPISSLLSWNLVELFSASNEMETYCGDWRMQGGAEKALVLRLSVLAMLNGKIKPNVCYCVGKIYL